MNLLCTFRNTLLCDYSVNRSVLPSGRRDTVFVGLNANPSCLPVLGHQEIIKVEIDSASGVNLPPGFPIYFSAPPGMTLRPDPKTWQDGEPGSCRSECYYFLHGTFAGGPDGTYVGVLGQIGYAGEKEKRSSHHIHPSKRDGKPVRGGGAVEFFYPMANDCFLLGIRGLASVWVAHGEIVIPTTEARRLMRDAHMVQPDTFHQVIFRGHADEDGGGGWFVNLLIIDRMLEDDVLNFYHERLSKVEA